MGNKKTYEVNKNSINNEKSSFKKGLEFGYIGVGQCGGNIANSYAELGYKAIAINTSETDLKKLNNIPPEHRLLISLGEIQGAGKDPSIGKAAIGEHFDEVMTLINQVFEKKPNVLYVCGGFGGGTGTGITPALVQLLILSGYDTPIGVICTLPADMESSKSKLVAASGFSELSGIMESSSQFIIDNNKISTKDNLGFKNQYIVANRQFSKILHNINLCCALPSEVAFDPRDFHTMLVTRGEIEILQIKFDDMAKIEDTYMQKINEAIKHSMFADTNVKRAKSISLVFETPKNGGAIISKNLIAKIYKYFDDPFEQNLGIYENRTMGREVVLNIVLAGLPFPEERLKDMESKVVEKEEIIQRIITEGQQQTYQSSTTELLDRFKSNPVTTSSIKTVKTEDKSKVNAVGNFLETLKLNKS